MIDECLSPKCIVEIRKTLSMIPNGYPSRGFALVGFVFDDGPNSKVSIYTVPIPENTKIAKEMIDAWGDRLIGSGGAAVMQMAEMTDDLIKDPATTGKNLGIWFVTLMFKSGVSLEEIVEQDYNLYLFTLRGQEFKLICSMVA